MDDDRRRAPREPLISEVEFVVDAHGILRATGVDISEVGVAFETDEPLVMALTLEVGDEEVTKLAQLVRMEQKEEGGFVFGLNFLEPGGD